MEKSCSNCATGIEFKCPASYDPKYYLDCMNNNYSKWVSVEPVREIPAWDEYFFNLAKVAASRSGCIRAQVGAVIVDQYKKVKSTGYNSVPSGIESCFARGNCYRQENKIPSGTQYETCRSIHAEQNAIIQAGEEKCRWSRMYIYGHEMVCILCKRFIMQAGITFVYLKKDDNSEVKVIRVDEDWEDL
jgi:dCMP deaminase